MRNLSSELLLLATYQTTLNPPVTIRGRDRVASSTHRSLVECNV